MFSLQWDGTAFRARTWSTIYYREKSLHMGHL
jgi:hypothetical protein